MIRTAQKRTDVFRSHLIVPVRQDYVGEQDHGEPNDARKRTYCIVEGPVLHSPTRTQAECIFKDRPRFYTKLQPNVSGWRLAASASPYLAFPRSSSGVSTIGKLAPLEKGNEHMVKFILCATRHPNMSRDAFRDYWLNHHGPLFKKFADTYRAVRYVQSHTIDSPLNENIRKSRGMSKEYDGVAEIWWRSEEDFLAAINSPEGQKLRAMFIEDEARFLDLSASSAFFTVEHVLIDGKV